MHIKAIDGKIIKFPYRMDDLRKSNANVSFPRNYESNYELLATFDVYPVVVAPKPAFDEKTHYVKRQSEPMLVAGVWTVGWDIISLSEEALLLSQQDSEKFLREERDRFLQATDWMALSDTTLTQEWAAYRQALRDLTDQPGFPHDVVWPSPPV